MHHDRALRGALAASMVVASMLTVAPSAMASRGGFYPSELGQQRCCPRTPDEAAAPDTVQVGRRIAIQSGRRAPDSRIGVILAQTARQPATEPPGEKPAAPPDQPEGEAPTADSEAFHGSAKPAGPDLTVNQERELISRGWD